MPTLHKQTPTRIDKDDTIMTSYKTSLSKGTLTVDDLNKAELEIIRHCQRKKFQEEINTLQKGEPIERSSHINKLNPVLQDGILRVFAWAPVTPEVVVCVQKLCAWGHCFACGRDCAKNLMGHRQSNPVGARLTQTCSPGSCKDQDQQTR